MEEQEPPLHTAAAGATGLSNKPPLYVGGNEDYARVKSFDALRNMFWIETVKLWQMAGSAVITIICMYGTNAVILLFAGHLGTIELSAISISLAVISTFTDGLMVFNLVPRRLPNAVIALGSLSICMNINGWEAMLFVGIYIAISVRVSNELGSGRPRATKYSIYVTVFQSLLIGILFMTIILITKDDFAMIFTSDKELQQAVSKLAYLLGITMVLNSVQLVISGVVVGCGLKKMVAYINLGCYYIFGLPFGYLLCHVANWGVKGFWVGMICGTVLQTLLLLIILYKTNWNKEVEQASTRVRKWGGQGIKTENGTESIED
ncbi:hypothetical protein C1H46_014938 [Malus baccata]|uniref:Polysaccharide biosynthesis protein C-terminal domain-containing protein n=1 Tax=Malus baccata TaxID=106549 RepID=A0A540ML06_MALBA|nr:hypothetical protein C1H46_014938 [Malus baccata]